MSAGTLRGQRDSVKEGRIPICRVREAPAGAWAPSQGHALQASGWRLKLKTRLGWALKKRAGHGATRKISASLPASSTAQRPAGHPEAVVTAKPSTMETVVQAQEQAAGSRAALRSAQRSGAWFCFSSSPLSFCCAWRGLTLDPEVSFCRETFELASPFQATAGTPPPTPPPWLPAPVLAAAFQLPAAPEDRVPVGPARGERWMLGTPGSGHRAGQLPSVNSTVFASQALPAGSPSCCGPGVSGGGEHNPPCVFQAARLLRESGLSQELACPPPAHP